MSTLSEFSGFPEACFEFLHSLKANNNTTWFREHKNEHESFVMEPARLFITDLGERLRTITPRINADPRVNRSLFRINRDTRFSKDKTPYKTHFAVWFWEGAGPRMESSGYYAHIEADKIMIGTGIYCFPKHLLEKYREYAVHRKHGPSLRKAIDKVCGAGKYTLGGQHYKRVPRGYDPGHKNAGLLLHSGLYAGMETDIPAEIHSADFLDYCFGRMREMSPIHEWLAVLTG